MLVVDCIFLSGRNRKELGIKMTYVAIGDEVPFFDIGAAATSTIRMVKCIDVEAIWGDFCVDLDGPLNNKKNLRRPIA